MPSDYIFRKAKFGGFNRDDVIAYISKLLAEAEINKAALDSSAKDNEALTSQLREAEEKLAAAEAAHAQELNALAEAHNAEIEAIRAEYEERIQNEILADRSAEEKIGTAMIDVRRYADLLISETCDKIDKMADDADNATAKTLSRVLDISSGIQAFSDRLNGILKDILMENEDLCKELTGFKGTLRLPFDEASGKIMADILED